MKLFLSPGARGALVGIVALIATPIATAQNVVAYDNPGGTFFESHSVSPLYPAGSPLLNAWPAVTPLPPAAIGPPAGAVTVDGTNGQTWYTNGLLIAAQPHFAYPSGLGVIPPFPAPPILPAPITGMAIDPLGGLLWLTTGAFVAAVVPAPGGPVVVPPFALPVPLAAPLTGLEWDALTGSLWACDAGGVVYNFLPGGAMLAPPMPMPVPPPGVCTGITIDKSGMPMPFARPILVLSGPMIVDVANVTVFPSNAPPSVGLTYDPAPSSFPPGAPCPCPSPGFNIAQMLTGPMSAGSPKTGVDLVGLPPGNPTVWIFDFAFNPAFPVINSVGCPLGVNLGSPATFTLGGAADPAGRASLPLSLVGIAPGSLLYLQIATLCPADRLGFVLSPLYQIAVSAP